MKKIFFGILASLLLTSGVYAGKGKKDRSKKASKAQTCSQASCDKTQCPSNCVGMPCCK
ncbi:MAG: hypothetical protein ABIQ07_00825 [Ginsengibacter sp.]